MQHRLSLVALLATSLPAQTNLLRNGDFEVGPPIQAGQTERTVTGSEIPGWFVPYGNCDYNGPFWTPSSGVRSIDLHGIERGAIEQAVGTVPGAEYEVVFDLGATGQVASLQIVVGNQTSPPFAHAGPPHPRVSYLLDNRWRFTATAPTSTVRFESLISGGANGPHLDNVRLYAVGSFATFGAGCSGSAGTPALSALGEPNLGATWTVQVSSLPAGAANVPFGILGVSRSTWAGLALPLSLVSIGAPGCDVLVSVDVAAPLTNLRGSATWDVPIPREVALAGAEVFVQAAVLDRPANALGLAVSNGGAARVGSR